MKYNNNIFALFVVFLLVLGTGCDHDTEQFDGPFLVDRFGDFSVLEDLAISRTTVDFSAGETVTFTARFNKSVEWIVQITGMQSGAVKRIEGFDNELVVDNATWEGGTTDLPLFTNELCMVELIVPEEENFTQSGEVEVVGTKTYEGNLFTSFETDPGDNIFFGNFEFELTGNSGRRNDMPAGQGEFYYLFEGTDNVVPNFFVGLADIKSSISGSTYAELPTSVPEDLYFNVFMYADGGPHGIAVIQFIYDSNDSGEFEEGTDQAFPLGDVNLNWTGWRHISKTMSEVGMTEEQVQKIVAIRVLLISDMNSQPNPPLQVDFGIDFLTFTANQPLEL